MLKKTTETEVRQQQDEIQIHSNDLVARISEHLQAELHHGFEC